MVADTVHDHLCADVPTDMLGVEIEWLVRDPAQPDRRPGLQDIGHVVERAGPLPAGGRLTIEPGGQIELVSAPHPSVTALCEAAATDLLHADRACNDEGLELVASGCDPTRAPRRVTEAPRYRAMQEHFDAFGDDGVRMMCNTASIQLNIGRGSTDAELDRRWRVANAIGPTMIAAFANSPFDERGATGWVSTRLRTWWGIDAGRAGPVVLDRPLTSAWERYALQASVMLVRRGDADFVALPPGFTFEQWLVDGHELGFPTADDLVYHLTTLFPPVRPRGWLELRMLDSLPTPFWHVATLVAATLLEPTLHDEVVDAIADARTLWFEAAEHGLRHPALDVAARRCFALVRAHLAAVHEDDGLQAVVATYDERWVQQARCPADDQLDRWANTGEVWPSSITPIPFSALEASVR
jgi:glutamate--cysteine ligase